MVKNGRYVFYHQEQSKDNQTIILEKIQNLINENQEYCDKINFDNLCNSFYTISAYQLLITKNKTKEQAKIILDVSSDRQVSYYYSSLIYIGLVKSNKQLNDETLAVKNDISKLKKLVIQKLLEKDLFKKLYEEFKNKELCNDLIIDEVKKTNSKLNMDTIKRRASTIKAWIEWIYLNE